MEVLGFSFSIWALIGGTIFGFIGLWLFRRAKKSINNRQVVLSIALMTYSLFVTNAWLTWAMGFFICCLAYACEDY